MPVRSLSLSVFKWPNRDDVYHALHIWVEGIVSQRRDVLRVGIMGSYPRGDWGVGSDLDIIVIVDQSFLPFWRRAVEWDLTSLPVPADISIYTRDEWDVMSRRDNLFQKTLRREAVWVYKQS